MQKSEKKNKEKTGFSMVEVLVSMFLISVGLMGAISLISSNLSDIINSRNQSIAGLLAEEGVELAINIRDTNIKNGLLSFEENFPTGDENDCIIDSELVLAGAGLQLCDRSFEEEKLFYFSDFRGYLHDITSSGAGKTTKFKRKIAIDYLDAISTKLTSVVIWGNSFPDLNNCNLATSCTYAETILTNWKDK